MGKTAVFGSIFVDVKGFPFGKYLPTGRNIGDVKFIHGGVCRNVAEDLANISHPVSFVTMFEDSGIGEEVRRRLAARGVDLKYAVTAPAGMGMWLAVFNEKGDLAGSISRQPDFSAMEKLVQEKCDEILGECSELVLEVDMNAQIAQMVFDSAERCGRDVYVVVGNMGVILKHPEYLAKAKLFIMNEIEAGCLFGCEFDPSNPQEVLDRMVVEAKKRGIGEIVVTLGEYGAVFFDAKSGDCGHIPSMKAKLVDSTGAGDAFFSGTVAARVNGLSLRKAAEKGTRLASLTIQSEESVCPRIGNFFED